MQVQELIHNPLRGYEPLKRFIDRFHFFPPPREDNPKVVSIQHNIHFKSP